MAAFLRLPNAGGLGAFLRSLKSGQFDNLGGAIRQAIGDDDLPEDKG